MVLRKARLFGSVGVAKPLQSKPRPPEAEAESTGPVMSRPSPRQWVVAVEFSSAIQCGLQSWDMV